MKQFVISLVCIFIILVYSIVSIVCIDNFQTEISGDIQILVKNNFDKKYINSLKETFEDKKNMLLLVTNKEHIDEIENNITSLKYAVDYGDIQNAATYAEIIENTVKEVKRSSCSII